jgi:hypothetical protein
MQEVYEREPLALSIPEVTYSVLFQARFPRWLSIST